MSGLSPLQASAVRVVNQLFASVVNPGSDDARGMDPGAFFKEFGSYSNAEEFKSAMIEYLRKEQESKLPSTAESGSESGSSLGMGAMTRPLNVKVEGMTIRAPLARRITGIGDPDEPGRSSEDSMKVIDECVNAMHTMYNVCDILHGDITDRSVCLTLKEDGSVRGVLVDLDEYDPEEIKVWGKERLELGQRL